MKHPLIIRDLGIKTQQHADYVEVWEAMKRFTDTRTTDTDDEIWLLEHAPVFTLGQAGKPEHLLNTDDIPVIKADRGGQVTYHGPGQLVIYLLLNLKRRKLGVRQLVSEMEQAIVELLAQYQVTAHPKADAPGVYVDNKKIASLGLRVRKGCSFHGLALNIDMDLEPFLRINPCGYAGLEMIQCSQVNAVSSVSEAAEKLSKILAHKLNTGEIIRRTGLRSVDLARTDNTNQMEQP